MLGRNDVSISPEWRKEVPSPSGMVSFFQAIFGSLKSAGIAITVVGGVVLLFPTVLATLGLATTAAIVFAPALLMALVGGVSAYREAIKARDKEKLLRQQLELHFSLAEKNLAAIQVNIDEAYQFLNGQETQSKEERRHLLIETLKSIEALRVITKNSDYEKEKYEHLVEAYNQLAGPYQASILLPAPPKAPGFFAGLYQDTKKFFSDLNKYRKTYGIGWASVEFFAKSWQIAKPFLGGAGIGLTLGAVAIGVTTMALGTGASFTGIGAIGGIPAVAVGAILIGAAVVAGLLTMAIKYLASKREQRRLDTIKTLTTTFSIVNAQHEKLNKEMVSVKAMQVARDKDRQLEDKEKRLNQKEEELKKKELELERREQLLAAAEKETASPSKEEKHASDSVIYGALNAETTKLFGSASQVIPKNEAEFAGPDEKKKPMGS